ncbi:6230_t:CDS:2 [Acaulospora colombiana]|uniref:6230_t:CDS:1 n=1 Tax=Acaulospora colombiana TaxID=27376 RepID=A0ACA9JUW5_9GLOM|nr:6230_t:CDS:2 [Acaulospora colombiana]
MKPFTISPPPPPKSNSPDGNDNQCNNKQPLIYAIAPQIQGQTEGNSSFIRADLKRRFRQVINATGFVNLTDVMEVRRHTSGNGYDHEHVEGGNCEHEAQGKGTPFEIVMKNNLIIVLQAYSRETSDEWIKRLIDLVRYWKARVENDAQTRINLFRVNRWEDDDHVSMVDNDDTQEHFNNFKVYADPYNLASKDNDFPKKYEDGLCSYDKNEECTFVIWKGKKRYTLEFNGKKANGPFGLNIKKKIKLNHPGECWVFRARNRSEREEWVWALNIEIARLCKQQNK